MQEATFLFGYTTKLASTAQHAHSQLMQVELASLRRKPSFLHHLQVAGRKGLTHSQTKCWHSCSKQLLFLSSPPSSWILWSSTPIFCSQNYTPGGFQIVESQSNTQKQRAKVIVISRKIKRLAEKFSFINHSTMAMLEPCRPSSEGHFLAREPTWKKTFP